MNKDPDINTLFKKHNIYTNCNNMRNQQVKRCKIQE